MRPTVVYIPVALLLCGSLLASNVIGQGQAPQALRSITAGTRVRITAPGALTPARQAGRVLALRPDTLVLQPDGGAAARTLPLGQVTGIEVSRRRHRSTVAGLFIGMVAGGATGAAVGAATYQAPKPRSTGCPNGALVCGPFNILGRGGSAAAGGVLGALVGGVVGTFVGHAHQSEDWAKVPWAQRTAMHLLAPNRLSIAPTSGGVALSVGLQFGGV